MTIDLKKLVIFLFFLPSAVCAKAPLLESSGLPREFYQISLLMPGEEVKKKLANLHFNISEENIGSLPIGLPYHFVVVENPTKEFWSFTYSFYKGKLNSIRAEYNLQNKPIDFEQYLSELKQKYGEPDEVSDESGKLFNVKGTVYLWRDKVTEMHVGYSPPGEVPIFGTPDLGALYWTILDRNSEEKIQKEIERATREFMEREEKERLEKNKR